MVVVKLELWPGGDEKRARPIGEVRISNDGTGSSSDGNYDVEVKHGGVYFGRPGAWRRGRVEGFRRERLSPYHLLKRALDACFGVF